MWFVHEKTKTIFHVHTLTDSPELPDVEFFSRGAALEVGFAWTMGLKKKAGWQTVRARVAMQHIL